MPSSQVAGTFGQRKKRSTASRKRARAKVKGARTVQSSVASTTPSQNVKDKQSTPTLTVGTKYTKIQDTSMKEDEGFNAHTSQMSRSITKGPQIIPKQIPSPNDTSSIGWKVLQVREAISILFMMTDCPKKVVPTSTFQPLKPDSAISLPSSVSLATETQIIEDFTFVSSTTTDPLKVRALCLELCDARKAQKFSLKIASNHGELETVKKGLKNVISHLKDDLPEDSRMTLAPPTAEALGIPDSRPDALLRSIVVLNFSRILCRLQSRHARWQGNFRKVKAKRVPIPTQLFNVFDNTRVSQITSDKARTILQMLRKLFWLLEGEASPKINPESSTAVTLLGNIIKCIYCLWRVPDCSAAISSQQLLKQLSKIARYVIVTVSLIEQRRKHPWIGSLEVEPVRLDPVSLPVLPEKYGTLEESASKLSISSNIIQQLPQNIRHIREHENKSPHKLFADLVNTKCVVHAEIQLLFHYELYGHSAMPRVILSTKAPCFLCALFFALHGRYRIPKSHGRLYEKWTLPSTLQKLILQDTWRMGHVMEEFLASLSERIIHTVSSSKIGELASSESLFRKSSVWARLRGPPSLIYVVDRKQPRERSSIYDTVLKPFRCSTTMLITKRMNSLRLGRGKRIAFQLDSGQADQTFIHTERLCLLFTSNNANSMPSETNDAEPRTNRPMVVKIWRLGSAEVECEEARALSKHVVDVMRLRPGEEAIVNQNCPVSTEFVVKHKGDYLLVQIEKVCHTATDAR